ncbi:uncharacterized protein LOC135701853 [Ochlerotatus camptorhynchus]|uniref:uncharacterized protein LOC135701853 n=1 Tax=Ochlerotatus camptorhynchus TaxID=644619 RepID=UPI0031D902AB
MAPPESQMLSGETSNTVIIGNGGAIKYAELKNDLQQFIQITVETVVEKCFGDHFSRLAALTEMNAKDSTKLVSDVANDPVENHMRIDNEVQLHDWNVKLGNEDLCKKYLVYFTRIIPPNSYSDNGDNACYTIVDCLFTREFWTRFTWTGISRGQKSKRGFREFGNVLQLLVKIVCIGDPTYSQQKLEAFCRNRLFRYSKSRSTSKQLRKSACRPARKQKRIKRPLQDDETVTNIKREDPLNLDQTDSAEENEQDAQNEAMDPEANEADTEHEDDNEMSMSSNDNSFD